MDYEYPNEFEFIPEDTDFETLNEIKLWSWRDDESEQLEILDKWEKYYRKQEKIKLAKQIRIERNGPTFEEWKEQRMKEKAQEKLTD